MSRRHALLSASSADRWLHCPPSARLCEKAEQEAASDYAAEGTDAHALCEYTLLKALGRKARDPTEDLGWYNAQMQDCADEYAEYVMGLYETAKQSGTEPAVLVEQRLDYSRYVQSGFGTADCIIAADWKLHVVDFKYGMGIKVDAQENPQMMLYALGALEIFEGIYDTETVSMTIFQPRLNNVSVWTISRDDLYTWAKNTLQPAAELAWNGEGEQHGGRWCQFCRVKATCRERARLNLELAKYDFQDPPLLEDEEISDILEKADALISWAKDVQEYALKEALGGHGWPGWKLVAGRSARKFRDEQAAAAAVQAAGYDPYEQKMLSLTALERMLGKKRFGELLNDYVYKPDGKPTLVPETDRRPTITPADDFKED